MTSVVADTGELNKIAAFKPDDATTNPSLILQLVQLPQHSNLIPDAVNAAKSSSLNGSELIDEVVDHLIVAVGCEIVKIVPGRVSIEVDARLSFSTSGSVSKARKIISMFANRGVNKSRIFIKLASTWECIRACEVLEKEGVSCNMTLLFSFHQAIAAAQANASLISPFVGRILDWHLKNAGGPYTSETDPGVLSVRRIYEHYKQHGYKTIVMAASFRNKDEILGLAGCDKLTIAPKLLEELSLCNEPVKRVLNQPEWTEQERPDDDLTEESFRWQMNQDAMATEKLAEGIRNFHKDQEKLLILIKSQLTYLF